jgi:hypothetical protein
MVKRSGQVAGYEVQFAGGDGERCLGAATKGVAGEGEICCGETGKQKDVMRTRSEKRMTVCRAAGKVLFAAE